MKKFTTIFAVALFGAVLGFACGGSKPAVEEPMETTNPCTPETTEGEGDMANPCAEGMGGDMYGGDSYGM